MASGPKCAPTVHQAESAFCAPEFDPNTNEIPRDPPKLRNRPGDVSRLRDELADFSPQLPVDRVSGLDADVELGQTTNVPFVEEADKKGRIGLTDDAVEECSKLIFVYKCMLDTIFDREHKYSTIPDPWKIGISSSIHLDHFKSLTKRGTTNGIFPPTRTVDFTQGVSTSFRSLNCN
jgi:hypothetical protein